MATSRAGSLSTFATVRARRRARRWRPAASGRRFRGGSRAPSARGAGTGRRRRAPGKSTQNRELQMADANVNNRVKNSLTRVRYFFGQLLTQRDLEAEQLFNLRLQRLIQRETFGTGTVRGLKVQPNLNGGPTPPTSVFITPGLAMDPDGRELLLENAVCVPVAEQPLQPGNFPF